LLSDFYKNNKNDVVWWVKDLDIRGRLLISFDKKKIFNLFEDYPHNLTKEQKEIFDKENPYWSEFFAYRT
jgi:hypothetical protein